MKQKQQFKPLVMFIPIVLLLICIFSSIFAGESFSEGLTNLTNVFLENFGWAYNLGVLIITVMVFLVLASPLGKVKIGGRKAKPEVSTLTYFAIVLCTIVAVGLPMWGAAEIMAHYSTPPVSLGVEAYTLDAAKFGLKAVLMDWTFAPYAVYALPSILMAFAFYNMKAPFSLGSMLRPLFGEKMDGKLGQVIDAICVFTLVCGLITSIGLGAEALIQSMGYLTDGAVTKTPLTVTILIILIAATFIASAASGVKKGIKFFSNLNVYIFIFMLIFVFIFGPTKDILNLGVETLGDFLNNFVKDITNMRALTGDNWAFWWPIFYFACYLAWALISSVFIGRVSYGMTFRKMITWSFIMPAIFTGVWMMAYSVTSLKMEMDGLGLADAYNANYASVITKFYSNLPLASIIIFVFIVMLFISFVTAADSCTNAIAGLCSVGLTEEDKEPPMKLKLFWGILMGVVALICTLLLDLTGLKAVSNLGGCPALIIELFGVVALWKIMWRPGKYDVHKEDYDKYGRPLPQYEDMLEPEEEGAEYVAAEKAAE